MEEVLTPIQWFPAIFAMSQFDSRVATFKMKCFFYFRISLILVVTMGAILYNMSVIKTVYSAHQGVIVSSIVFAQYIFRMSTTVCCLLAFRPAAIWAFCKSNGKLDEEFKALLGQGMDYREGRKLSRQLAVFVVAKVVLQQIPYYMKGLNWDLTLIDYLAWNMPLLLIHGVLLQWMVYTNILKVHFVNLNRILKTLFKYRQCWIADHINVMDSSSTKPITEGRCTNIETVRRSAEIYDKLCQQAANLNGAFGRQMLFIIPTLFILIIYNSFRVCEMIKNKIDFEAETVIFDVLYLVSLMEMVIPCVRVKQEGDSFVDVLHKIDVIDDSIILQMYHQKIQFSACGVFPLDGTLVYTISGALTTYLVILLQFDL